ncbi:MAG: hypothetical protein IT306_13705 [Chloroflexi bacterium]|nr:hypothetical protein [Chloroflexota bacterium]
MRRTLAAIFLAGMVVLAGISAWPAVAQTGACQLAPVFVMLRDLVGRERVGECAGPAIRNDAGDFTQATARGTMTLRSSDLVATFSDGQTTWLYGPRGLESRGSTGRLPWETAATTAVTGPLPGGQPPAGQTTAPAGSVPSGTVAGPTVATPMPSPVPLSTLPLTFDGDDTATTRPFDLAGGDYRVAYEAEIQRGNQSCYVGSRLRRAGDANPGSLVVHTTLNSSSDRTLSGETRLFGVAPGRYVLDVMTTGCAWKITLLAPR